MKATDAQLIDAARNGDEAAFATLYLRHRSAAFRHASTYRRAADAGDLVNEAFEQILRALKRGSGPEDAFRAYLFVTIRRLAWRKIKRNHDDPVAEVPEPLEGRNQDAPMDLADRSMIVSAYESLPDRWQAVLWETAVQGRQPRELASDRGVSANAAAALAYRAREKLRQAYLQAHLQAAPRPECEPHCSRLGAYVRDALSRREQAAASLHLEGCSACRGLVALLRDVNSMLVRSLAPVSTAASGSTAFGTPDRGAGRLARLGTRVRSAAAVAAAIALAVALGLALLAQRHGGQDGSFVGGHLKLPAGGQWVPNDGHYGVWSARREVFAVAATLWPGYRHLGAVAHGSILGRGDSGR